jgi:hypothetical protein
VCDIVKLKEGNTVIWSSSEAHEDNSSPEYLEVWGLDKLKMMDNIRQGGIC